MTRAFICMYQEKITGRDLSHHSSAHRSMPCSRHQGQRTDSLTIQFVVLPPSREGGLRSKKRRNPIIFICPSHRSAENANGGETAAMNFLHFTQKRVYLLLHTGTSYLKKKNLSFRMTSVARQRWVVSYPGLLTESWLKSEEWLEVTGSGRERRKARGGDQGRKWVFSPLPPVRHGPKHCVSLSCRLPSHAKKLKVNIFLPWWVEGGVKKRSLSQREKCPACPCCYARPAVVSLS